MIEKPASAVGGMIALGLSVGAGLGVLTGNMAVYMPVGMLLGIFVGYRIDMIRRRKTKD